MTRSECCRCLMLGQYRSPDALKYGRNELPADLAASGRDKPHCPRQLIPPVTSCRQHDLHVIKHDTYKFSAFHLNQKLCYKSHNFVPIYLPTPVHNYVCTLYIEGIPHL